MAKARSTFDAVRTAGLQLPQVAESTMYGSPALKVNGNLLACMPVHKSAEANCAAFSIDFDLRAALIKQMPDVYYVTDHYANYPIVLARLSRMSPKELGELLGLSWSFVSAKKPAGRSSPKASGVSRSSRDPKRKGPVTAKPGGHRQ